MIRYVLGRVLQSVIVVLGVVTIVFILLHLLPGNEARAILGIRSTPAQWAVYNHQNGLDQPLPVQYVAFLGNLAHGTVAFTPPGFADQVDPLEGVEVNIDMRALVAGPLVNSLTLTSLSLLLAAAFTVPISAYEARRAGRGHSRVFGVVAVAAYAAPPFFVGTLLIGLFTSTFPILSLNAPGWTTGDVLAEPPALILPSVTLALGYGALFTRYLRATMVHELAEDYAIAARARGAGPDRVLWHHVLRNALLPVITLLGSRLPLIFGAQLVIEVLFGYPGIGATMWTAGIQRDYYTMLGAILISGVLTVAGSLASDLLYAVADPRVRTARAR